MKREIILSRTINNISLLPDWRLKEVSDYVEFLLKSFEDKKTTEGIMKLASKLKSFEFLNEEEDLYDENDLIEKY